MNALLREVIDTLQQLPDKDQQHYAQLIHAMLEDDQRWDDTFCNSPSLLEQLAAEAHAEYITGETEAFDVDDTTDK